MGQVVTVSLHNHSFPGHDAFRCRGDDDPLLVVFGSALPHQLKNLAVKVGPPLAKFS